MNSKKIVKISLGALLMTIVIFVMEINFYNGKYYTTGKINEILFWSFIRGLVIAIGVNFGNHYFSKLKDK